MRPMKPMPAMPILIIFASPCLATTYGLPCFAPVPRFRPLLHFLHSSRRPCPVFARFGDPLGYMIESRRRVPHLPGRADSVSHRCVDRRPEGSVLGHAG